MDLWRQAFRRPRITGSRGMAHRPSSHAPGRADLTTAILAAVVTLAAATAAAQRDPPDDAFVEALSEFRIAVEGSYGDEGPHIVAALDRMTAALARAAPQRRTTPFRPTDEPLLPLSAYAAGYAQLARGEHEAAVRELRRAAAVDPLIRDPAAGSATLNQAASALRQQQPARARSILEASGALNDSSEAHRVLGLAYWLDSRDDESILHLEAAVHRNPRNERARVALARVLSDAGRHSEAERVLLETLDVLPGSAHARWWLGSVYERLNRVFDARREIEHAVTHAVAGHAVLHAAVGRLAARASDIAGASAAFARAVEASPNDPALRKSLAGYLLQQDRTSEALTELTAALQIDPDDAIAHAAVGEIHLNAGRHDEAVTNLRRALVLSPAHTEARFALATALMRLGQREEAEREFARVADEQRQALAERRRTMSSDVRQEESILRGNERTPKQ